MMLEGGRLAHSLTHSNHGDFFPSYINRKTCVYILI